MIIIFLYTRVDLLLPAAGPSYKYKQIDTLKTEYTVEARKLEHH